MSCQPVQHQKTVLLDRRNAGNSCMDGSTGGRFTDLIELTNVSLSRFCLNTNLSSCVSCLGSKTTAIGELNDFEDHNFQIFDRSHGLHKGHNMTDMNDSCVNKSEVEEVELYKHNTMVYGTLKGVCIECKTNTSCEGF